MLRIAQNLSKRVIFFYCPTSTETPPVAAGELLNTIYDGTPLATFNFTAAVRWDKPFTVDDTGLHRNEIASRGEMLAWLEVL